MGETTCIVQDNGCAKADIAAALRESVSFGRFVSEPLEWGKWSSFRQNRYLEEAEKYSARGSVAQKKAYFEAKYKRIALKKAAELLEQANAAAASSACTEHDDGRGGRDGVGSDDAGSGSAKSSFITPGMADENCNCSQFGIAGKDHGFLESEAGVVWEEKSAGEDAALARSEVDGTAIPRSSFVSEDSIFPLEEVCNTERADVEKDAQAAGRGHNFQGQSPLKTSGIPEEIERQNDHILNAQAAGGKLEEQLQKTPNKPEDIENRNHNIAMEQLQKTPNKPEDIENQNHNIAMEHSRPNHRQKLPFKESSFSNQQIAASTDGKSRSSILKSSFLRKTYKALPSASKSMTSTLTRKENNTTPGDKKTMKSLNDKKSSTPNSLHISVNQSPRQNCETTPETKAFLKVSESKVSVGCFKAFPDFSSSRRTPTREHAFGESKITPKTTQSEERSKTPSAKRKTDAKWQSLIVNHGRSSCAGGSNSSQVVSSFCFRSEERAEKRKEYFLKLEEKLNADKLERQAEAKEKAENELKLLRQSLGFKARPLPNFYHKNESSKLEKNVVTRPQSPKLSVSDVLVVNSRPPLRLPVKSERSKFRIGK